MQEQIIIKPNGKVVLHLPGKQYKPYRNIGTIDKKIFYSYRSSQKNQKYNNSNSVGFCYHLISNYRHLISAICINYDAQVLWTTPKAIFKYGTFKKYSKNDLELQIFMALDNFKDNLKEAEEECFALTESDKPKIKPKQEAKVIISDENQLDIFALAI